MSRRILITGAASGLGLEFVKRYAECSTNRIIAIDLSPLPDSVRGCANVDALQADVTSQSLLASLQFFLRNSAIDLVIHSAGVRGLVPAVEKQHPDDVAACETMQVMDTDTMIRAFQINAVGTFSLIRGLLPYLQRSSGTKVVVMSSRMGSVGHNTTGSAYAYRASKAALNAIVKSFSIDVPSVAFILCHPGRVETKLVKCKEEGAISPAESVSTILPLVEGWSTTESGSFFDRFGEPIVW